MTDQPKADADAPPAGAPEPAVPKIEILAPEIARSDAAEAAKDEPSVKAGSASPRRQAWRPNLKPALTALRPLAVPRQHRALAAGLALGVALGGATGAGAVAALKRTDGPTAADFQRLAQRLEDNSAARLAAEVKGLREQVAIMKDSAERGRGDSGGRIAQIGERLEKLQRTEQEVAKTVTALAERIERADRDEAQRLAALGERLEKRFAAQAAQAAQAAPTTPAPAPQAATPAAKSADPVQTGAIAGATPPAVVSSWTLREVYDGIAMLENRNQRLLEVAPGSTVPGVGRVEAIERRGKAWVVVTSKGLITAQAW